MNAQILYVEAGFLINNEILCHNNSKYLVVV